jgi:hypothetical protein
MTDVDTHDGTHQLFGREVCGVHEQKLSVKVDGFSAWPAGASDINTLEFFLWSFMKYRVYQSHNLETVQYVAGFQVEDTAGKGNETEHFQWERLME